MRKLTAKRLFKTLKEIYTGRKGYSVSLTLRDQDYEVVRLFRNERRSSFSPLTVEFTKGKQSNLWVRDTRYFGFIEDLVLDKSSILIQMSNNVCITINLNSERIEVEGDEIEGI